MPNINALACDVGTVRIGVAVVDGGVAIPRVLPTIDANEHVMSAIAQLAYEHGCDRIVLGYPRNQSGEPTAQSHVVEVFAERLQAQFDGTIIFQDESLTSHEAENRLLERKRPYTKGDIDAEAARIILHDYLESVHE